MNEKQTAERVRPPFAVCAAWAVPGSKREAWLFLPLVCATLGTCGAADPALQPASADSLVAQAERALAQGEPLLAMGTFQEIPADSGLHLRARHGEAVCLLALGQVVEAIRVLREIEDLSDAGGDEVDVAAGSAELLGLTYLQIGEIDLALRVFGKLARRYPDRADYAAVLTARAHQVAGSYHAAFAALKPVLRRGLCQPAYDLALVLHPRLDRRAQEEMTDLLRGYLTAAARSYNGSPPAYAEESGR